MKTRSARSPEAPSRQGPSKSELPPQQRQVESTQALSSNRDARPPPDRARAYREHRTAASGKSRSRTPERRAEEALRIRARSSRADVRSQDWLCFQTSPADKARADMRRPVSRRVRPTPPIASSLQTRRAES